MKLTLKMIAIAAAIASMAGAAHADLTPANTGNGSLAVVAFNTATRDFYIRDTGFFINSFLPTGITTLPGDGNAIGDKTPETGLMLNKTNTTSFADPTFGTWLGAQDATSVRWFVTASDSISTTQSGGVARAITSSATALTASNGQVGNYAASGNAGNLNTLAGGTPFSLSFSAHTGAPGTFDSNFGLGSLSLASLNQSVGLYYLVRAQPTGGLANPASVIQYGNTTGFAAVTLASNGDFSYSLAGAPAAPVPEPSTVWLMGAGLIGAVGALRRRKSADQA
ncbi:MAG: hypothetical protein CFE40_02415 [Burkholderiales bacterium PBB1]|nr:MAG: hypothetical protein CFE40_02415 [Burkholderiales bacterium PBB1]